ncbi:hypothetical protein [Frankia sp. AgW1.1]|uniref:hypothetical protein n=1 Tax=Frankia sp. AgW1.1 TaxID=1836971 RepID=UPI0019341482|nr:hypothetical protein [Frankia sp. AgW1.1]MBL7487143.1 hypothetical protein [Frankia sp. AgW1.1]
MTRRTAEYAGKHAGHNIKLRADGRRFCQTCAEGRVADRRDNVRSLTADGWTAKDIAARLYVTSRTVERDRLWLRQVDSVGQVAA